MFGIGGDPFEGQEQSGGPLANLPGGIASVLNGNGNENAIWIPGGPGEPVFQVPNPRRFFQPRYGALYSGQHRSGERLTPGDVGVLLVGAAVLVGLIAAVSALIGWLI